MSRLQNSIRRPSPSLRRVTCEMEVNPNQNMDELQAESIRAVWQVFNTFDTNHTGSVPVSQLKAISATLGLKLGFDKAEEFIKGAETGRLEFETFYNIIKSELIDKLEAICEKGGKSFGQRVNDIVRTCWTLCPFEREHKSQSMTSDHCMVVWRLFNFLSETDESGNPKIPICLDAEEAALLFKDFIDITGQRSKEHQINQFLTGRSENSLLTFTEFLNVFEKDYVVGLSRNDISHGLHQLYETYILNTLGKGMMSKRGYKVKHWKERWLVLTPKCLKYYVSSNERDMKGQIDFDSKCDVEIPPDRPTHKPNRFIITTPKKPYEMSAPDIRTKNEWVSAIQKALASVDKDPNLKKIAALERCMARADKRRLEEEGERKRQEEADLNKKRQDELDEEKRKRLEDEELLKSRLKELEAEKLRREEAEARALEEQALREAEQERLRELEAIKLELERLLAEERQAKKDEEIVRNLQAKLLEEEFEKRQELEQLKKQQEEMLKAEREQKAVLEGDRREQERALQEAQERLEQLERDRAAAAEKMQEASEKLIKAEHDRHIMEQKEKLWKTPVGLKRLILPHPEPLVTHRGLGAFCNSDFSRKTKSGAEQSDSSESTKDSGEISEMSIKEPVSDGPEIEKNETLETLKPIECLTDKGESKDINEDNSQNENVVYTDSDEENAKCQSIPDICEDTDCTLEQIVEDSKEPKSENGTINKNDSLSSMNSSSSQELDNNSTNPVIEIPVSTQSNENGNGHDKGNDDNELRSAIDDDNVENNGPEEIQTNEIRNEVNSQQVNPQFQEPKETLNNDGHDNNDNAKDSFVGQTQTCDDTIMVKSDEEPEVQTLDNKTDVPSHCIIPKPRRRNLIKTQVSENNNNGDESQSPEENQGPNNESGDK